MKKLNLKIGGIREMLTREQMKKVVGGDYGGYGVVCTGSVCSGECPCKASADWCVNGACTSRP